MTHLSWQIKAGLVSFGFCKLFSIFAMITVMTSFTHTNVNIKPISLLFTVTAVLTLLFTFIFSIWSFLKDRPASLEERKEKLLSELQIIENNLNVGKR